MDYLFDDVRVEECLARMVNQIRFRINGEDEATISDPEKRKEFFNYIIKTYKIKIPQIDETKIEKTTDYGKVYFHIPFEGDKSVFKLSPYFESFNPLQGEVKDSKIIMSVRLSGESEMQEEINRKYRKFKEYLKEVSQKIAEFNDNTIKEVFCEEVANIEKEIQKKIGIKNMINRINIST